MVDNQTKTCYNTSMKNKKYEQLARICGGNITPEALKLVFLCVLFNLQICNMLILLIFENR